MCRMGKRMPFLPHTMRFNLDASAARQALIAEAMGINTAV